MEHLTLRARGKGSKGAVRCACIVLSMNVGMASLSFWKVNCGEHGRPPCERDYIASTRRKRSFGRNI